MSKKKRKPEQSSAAEPPVAAPREAPASPSKTNAPASEPIAALIPWERWFPLVLAAAAMLAYANSFNAPFVFDDQTAIIENPFIESIFPLSRSLSAPPQTSLSGRPAVSFSFALNYAFGGRAVGGYHFLNIAIHASAAIVLFLALRAALSLAQSRWRWNGSPLAVAMAASLLWLLHPIQTESVTYIVQRAESMLGLFYLLTLHAFIMGVRAPSPAAREAWFAASVLACLVGMACKEVMATAPFAVLLFDRIFVAKSWRELFAKRWRIHASIWATLALLAWLVASGPRSGSAGFGLAEITPLNYARAQFGIILHYLRLVVAPFGLTLDYNWPPARAWTLGVLLSMAVVLGMLAATLYALFRGTAVGYAAFCFFLVLAPSSTFIPIADLAFEHRMYLPLAFLAPLAVAAGGALLRRFVPDDAARFKAGIAIVAALAVFYAGLTLARNHDYRTAEAVWRDVIAKRPLNPRGYNNLGTLLNRNGDHAGAIPLFLKALQIKPDYVDALYNLGNSYADTGRRSDAIAQYSRALEIDPTYWKASNNLGMMLYEIGNMEGALRHVREALRLNPYYADAHNNLGSILGTAGHLEEAIREFETAIKLRPDYPDAQQNLQNAIQALRDRNAAPR